MTAERDGSLYYETRPAPPTVDQILKTVVIYELHGLNDIAVDTAVHYSDELGARVDVERAVDLLCERDGHMQVADPHLQRERVALQEQIETLRNSTSWRITAPLRNIVDRVRQAMR